MDISEEPGGSQNVVYIFNISEDVWPFINAIGDSTKKQFEINENSNLVDHELFSCTSEKHLIFISPQQIPQIFIDYFLSLFPLKSLEIWVPKNHSGLICEDILQDQELINKLIFLGKKQNGLILKSYSSSPQFYKLIHLLEDNGIMVTTPEAPAYENYWTVNFYGSKSGIRQLVQKCQLENQNIRMADGFICMGIEDASTIAADKYVANNGVVLKTHKGHAGMGVLIYRPGALSQNYHDCQQEILNILKKDFYWDKFPIIVEDYIDTDPTIGGGFPNAELRINENGEVEFLYPCGLRVTPEGVFKGIEINENIFPVQIGQQLKDICLFLGKQYAKDGYRGYFEFDFAVGKDGKLYISESNVRRTGGTYVYHTARTLIGENFIKETYILSDNIYKLPPSHTFTFEEILDRLESVLFSKEKKEGVVLAAINMLHQGSITYIIFGENKDRAIEIEKQMKRLLAG